MIIDNGFNPIWNEDFKFIVNCPELAFVRFNVLDEDVGKDQSIGYYTIRFENMRQGTFFFYLSKIQFLQYLQKKLYQQRL